MTTGQKIMRGKGGLLDLANQLGNVSQRRGNVGYGRESSIGLRSSTSQGGDLALQEMSRKNPVLKALQRPSGLRMPAQASRTCR